MCFSVDQKPRISFWKAVLQVCKIGFSIAQNSICKINKWGPFPHLKHPLMISSLLLVIRLFKKKTSNTNLPQEILCVSALLLARILKQRREKKKKKRKRSSSWGLTACCGEGDLHGITEWFRGPSWYPWFCCRLWALSSVLVLVLALHSSTACCP